MDPGSTTTSAREPVVADPEASAQDPAHPSVEYTYHPKVFDELGRFGLRPKPTTPPSLAKEFVDDLYRYELRTLRARLVTRKIPRQGYADRVVGLRKKYFLLSIRLDLWTTDKDDARRHGSP